MPTIPGLSVMAPLFAATARTESPALLGAVVGVAIVGALAVLVLLRAVLAIRGTTLFAPLVWSLLSLASLFSMFAINGPGALLGGIQQDKWWLLAATSSFCPLVALLGAKRPQNRAWQLIVFSFWGIIALPAVQSLALQPRESMELHVLWRWFFVVLICMGPLNYLSTPFGIVGVAVATSQVILLWKWLPLAGTYTFWQPEWGVMVACGAILLAAVVTHVRKRALPKFGAAAGWNRVWLDFHDFYGLVWSRRVMQRVEAEVNAPVEWLDWYDFRSGPVADAVQMATPESDSNSDDIRTLNANNSWTAAAPALQSLLRRFVSPEWIEQRIRGEV